MEPTINTGNNLRKELERLEEVWSPLIAKVSKESTAGLFYT